MKNFLFKSKKILSFSIILIYLAVMGIILFSVFSNSTLLCSSHGYYFLPVHKIYIFLFSSLFIICMYFLYRFLKKRQFEKRTLWIITIGLAIFYLIFQGFTYYLLLKPTWDFGAVFDSVNYYIQDGVVTHWTWMYLSQFPNNLLLFMVETLLFKFASIFGITNFGFVAILTNAILIDLAVLFLFLFLKKNHSFELAIMGLLFSILIAPIVLYTPIFYTDTFSIFFPIFLMYCYSFIRKEDITKKNWYWPFLIGFATFFGMKFKITVAIVTIAIIIDMILQNNWKNNFKSFGIILIAMLIGLGVFQGTYHIFFGDLNLSSELQIPYNHWIKMGMHGFGGYNEEDYQLYSVVTDPLERKKVNNEEIVKTLQDYGISGYAKFLNDKIFYTWGDGTYFSAIKLSRETFNRDNFMAKTFRAGAPYFMKYLYIINIIHYALLLLLMGSGILSLVSKKDNLLPRFLSIIGIFLFLLMWETRSRYLYNFIPIFISCAIPFFDGIFDLQNNFLKKKN